MNNGECFISELELFQYLDGEIHGIRRAYLDNHVILCDECSRSLAEWGELKSQIKRSSGNMIAPESLKEKVSHNIKTAALTGDAAIMENAKGSVSIRQQYPF